MNEEKDYLLSKLYGFASQFTSMGSAVPVGARRGIEAKYAETYRQLTKFGYPKPPTKMR